MNIQQQSELKLFFPREQPGEKNGREKSLCNEFKLRRNTTASILFFRSGLSLPPLPVVAWTVWKVRNNRKQTAKIRSAASGENGAGSVGHRPRVFRAPAFSHSLFPLPRSLEQAILKSYRSRVSPRSR